MSSTVVCIEEYLNVHKGGISSHEIFMIKETVHFGFWYLGCFHCFD